MLFFLPKMAQLHSTGSFLVSLKSCIYYKYSSHKKTPYNVSMISAHEVCNDLFCTILFTASYFASYLIIFSNKTSRGGHKNVTEARDELKLCLSITFVIKVNNVIYGEFVMSTFVHNNMSKFVIQL